MNSTKNSSNEFNIVCVPKSSVSFACRVESKNETEKTSFKMVGSWFCNGTDRVFQLTVNKTTITLKHTRDDYISFGKVNITGQATFSEPANNNTQVLQLNISNHNLLLWEAEIANIKLFCNCSNMHSLQKQISRFATSQKISIKEEKCWATSSTCLRYYCMGLVDTPQKIRFSFNGEVKCSNTNYPDYKIHIKLYYNEATFSKSLCLNRIEKEEHLSIELAKATLDLTVNVAINKSGNSEFNLNLNFSARFIVNKQVNRILNGSSFIEFTKLNCSQPSPILPSPSAVTKNNLSKSQINTTSNISTSSFPYVEISTSLNTYLIAPNVTSPFIITSSLCRNGTGRIINVRNYSSHPARVVLIVLAVLIVLTVIVVGCYLKKRKRLSNQPAYYNDIALNDPLRYELDNEAEQEDDDDDELPLFA